MALTIKNADVERLAAEVAGLTGETKTQAIRVALEERRRRLHTGVDPEARKAEILRWLEDGGLASRARGTARQAARPARDDEILGYGPTAFRSRRMILDTSAIVAVLLQPGGGRRTPRARS